MVLRLGWNLWREADQVKDQKRLSNEKPYLLILSPMCLGFSQLQALNTKPERLAELLEQGRRHAVWQSHKSSEVDAFFSSILGRRRRGTSRA